MNWSLQDFQGHGQGDILITQTYVVPGNCHSKHLYCQLQYSFHTFLSFRRFKTIDTKYYNMILANKRQGHIVECKILSLLKTHSYDTLEVFENLLERN